MEVTLCRRQLSKMEAVPRMPMLAFQLKISAEPVEFAPALKGVSYLRLRIQIGSAEYEI